MIKVMMNETLRVSDVMSREVHVLRAEYTVQHGAALLAQLRVGGAPVIQGSSVAGVVSKSDLLDPRRRDESTVGDIMTRVVFGVRPTDPLMQAVRLMARESIHRVVVVAESGELVGIVSSMDILAALARGAHVEGATADPLAEPELSMGYVDLRKTSVRY